MKNKDTVFVGGKEQITILLFQCCIPTQSLLIGSRLGKYARPRVLDDQKKAVDKQKMIPGRPHDDQIIFLDNLNF